MYISFGGGFERVMALFTLLPEIVLLLASVWRKCLVDATITTMIKHHRESLFLGAALEE